MDGDRKVVVSSRGFTMARPHRSLYVSMCTLVSVFASLLPLEGARAAPPVLTVPGPQTVNEGQTLQFGVSAVDPEGVRVELRAVAIPLGATFVDNRNNTGTFDWTPAKGDAGSHAATFVADDTFGETDTETVAIDVFAVNTPPVLGPLSDRIVDPGTVAIISIWATDDDGDALTFSASGVPSYGEFTDYGSNSAGLILSPPLGTPGGTYGVTVTVSDGMDTDAREFLVTITGEAGGSEPLPEPVQASAWTHPKMIHLGIGASWQRFYLEAASEAIGPTDIDPASVRVMAWAGAGNGAAAPAATERRLPASDQNENGIPELRFDVMKSDLQAIFSNLGEPTDGPVTVMARDRDGREVTATFLARVIPAQERAIKRVGPNPLNPEAIVEIETSTEGRLRVMVFDVHGRMVRVLAADDHAPAGTRTLRFDGHDDHGRQLRGGRYFVRVESTRGRESTPLTILP